MSLIEANDATLYYERRGSGPTVLFISGATGDAGAWTEVANILAEESTVVTYDRRANSRSPRPPGWTPPPSTSRPMTRLRCSRASNWRPPWCSAPAPAPASWPTCAYIIQSC